MSHNAKRTPRGPLCVMAGLGQTCLPNHHELIIVCKASFVRVDTHYWDVLAAVYQLLGQSTNDHLRNAFLSVRHDQNQIRAHCVGIVHDFVGEVIQQSIFHCEDLVLQATVFQLVIHQVDV